MTRGPGSHHHTIRVMTWNVRGAARPDVATLARAIAVVDPHVLALQEVRPAQASRLATILDFPEHRWLLKHHATWPLGSRWAEGLAVLSRFPVRAERTTVLTPSASVRSYRRRVLQEVTVTTGGGAVRIANVHLSSDHDGDRADQAARVVAALASTLEDADVGRTILLGDLNTDDDPAVIGRFATAGLHGGESPPTNPAGAATQRLDHVLAGAAFDLGTAVVPDDDAEWARRSDHLPVSADVVLAHTEPTG